MTRADGAHLTLLAVIFLALTLGSLVRLVALRGRPEGEARARRGSLASWWALFLLLSAAVLFGHAGICVLLTAASLLALREYFRLIDPSHRDALGEGLLYLLAPATYGAIFLGWGWRAMIGLPLAAVVVISATRILTGAVKGFIRNTGALLLGAMLLVFGPAHAALLLSLERTPPAASDGVGLFLLLIVLTEINDISQALVGRRLGRHKLTPVVSPNKTWEGFLGGVVVTCLLGGILTPLVIRSPLVTADSPVWLRSALPLFAGGVIAVSGVLGDLIMSAIKRDLEVKDSSSFFPGMGGVLDRIDSLTLSAPCFYWLLYSVT